MTIVAWHYENVFDFFPASNHVSESVLIVCEELRDEDEIHFAAEKIVVDNGHINTVGMRYIENLYDECGRKVSSHVD